MALTGRKDRTLRQKIVDRITRIESEVLINQMEFDDANRRLKASKQSLLSAQAALHAWDSNATETVIDNTSRMSLDPDTSRVSKKGKARASVFDA